MLPQFTDLLNRLKAVEERFADQFYDMTGFLDSAWKRGDRIDMVPSTEFGIHKAFCISTIDPRKQGRIRYYCPYLDDPETDIDQLQFASPISPAGGFDDCGMVWVPPASSTVMLAFEAGFRQQAFYLGTIWPRDRTTFGYEKQDEWEEIHKGHRKGYFIGPGELEGGPNSEQQDLPPWNTENYMDYDLYTVNEKEVDPEKIKQITYPHIYGWKTPQKHMLKWVDGDYQCHHRWKRMELMSSVGNWMIFKDDHLHPQAQWANPACCGGTANPDCVDEDGNPIEKPEECPADLTDGNCINPFYKHKNECRPYVGNGLPQNNKINLPQSGIQLMSLSGHVMIFDDTVEEPTGIPDWERNLEPFSTGCNDRMLGRMRFITSTGHRIEGNDEEKEPFTRLRGNSETLPEKYEGQTFDAWGGRPRNGLLLLTATGNRIELNDETKAGCIAGANRGIFMQSTSNHTLEMKDELNEQCSPTRKEGGIPKNKAKRGFVRIRSGYGLLFEMGDFYDQEETDEQYIMLMAPQKDACCGPHFFRMQESPDCGFIFLRAAGDYICLTEGRHFTVVGNEDGECLGPQSKIEIISKDKILDISEVYYNHADTHVFHAERNIVLAAGRDCESDSGEEGPCIYPVLVAKCMLRCPIFPFMLHPTPQSISTRVYASTNGDDCSISTALSSGGVSPFVNG